MAHLIQEVNVLKILKDISKALFKKSNFDVADANGGLAALMGTGKDQVIIHILKPGKNPSLDKALQVENKQIDEARPANLLKAISSITKSDFFEKRIEVMQTVDGMTALFRAKDGNAYVVTISAASDSDLKNRFKQARKKK